MFLFRLVSIVNPSLDLILFSGRTLSGDVADQGGRPMFGNTEKKQTRPGSKQDANTFVEEKMICRHFTIFSMRKGQKNQGRRGQLNLKRNQVCNGRASTDGGLKWTRARWISRGWEMDEFGVLLARQLGLGATEGVSVLLGPLSACTPA